MGCPYKILPQKILGKFPLFCILSFGVWHWFAQHLLVSAPAVYSQQLKVMARNHGSEHLPSLNNKKGQHMIISDNIAVYMAGQLKATGNIAGWDSKSWLGHN